MKAPSESKNLYQLRILTVHIATRIKIRVSPISSVSAFRGLPLTKSLKIRQSFYESPRMRPSQITNTRHLTGLEAISGVCGRRPGEGVRRQRQRRAAPPVGRIDRRRRRRRRRGRAREVGSAAVNLRRRRSIDRPDPRGGGESSGCSA